MKYHLEDTDLSSRSAPCLVAIVEDFTGKTLPDKMTLPWKGRDVQYHLDAKIMLSASWTDSFEGANPGHAICGVTCSGRRYCVDSNGKTGLYDWRNSTTEYLSSEHKFDSRTNNACIYYNTDMLRHVHGVCKDIVESLDGASIVDPRARAAARKRYAAAFDFSD
jgi:hypothetical protein